MATPLNRGRRHGTHSFELSQKKTERSHLEADVALCIAVHHRRELLPDHVAVGRLDVGKVACAKPGQVVRNADLLSVHWLQEEKIFHWKFQVLLHRLCCARCDVLTDVAVDLFRLVFLARCDATPNSAKRCFKDDVPVALWFRYQQNTKNVVRNCVLNPLLKTSNFDSDSASEAKVRSKVFFEAIKARSER